ncbi:MAG: type III pantothenate kinase [Kiritimatiellia bacterium]|nr:type III pantothenate kinase [Lentisphaerota bacterium]
MHDQSKTTVLAVDIGNSSVSAALICGNRVRRSSRLLTSAGVKSITAVLRKVTAGQRAELAAISTVVPRVLYKWMKETRKFAVTEPISVHHNLRLGLRLDYPRPQTLGADRLANAVAANHYFGAPAIVIDCGTATTVDLIDTRHGFQGGIILPGPPLFLTYLHEHTAMLPSIDLPHRAPLVKIGKNTEAAMRLGAWLGYRGMLRESVAALQSTLRRTAPVIVTGGYARRIMRGSGIPTHTDEFLTLRGIALLALMNK